ncbi:MAG: 23S rRNA (guanosine(2251)-2'-O)-methyltransferase RlmB, partial [Deltaproteobacteria bacterium]|nr:23S rRNA (guanosine(2251)-2'-O)-methyltransferase RlmB [Deltaproteobacteria bacterium]
MGRIFQVLTRQSFLASPHRPGGPAGEEKDPGAGKRRAHKKGYRPHQKPEPKDSDNHVVIGLNAVKEALLTRGRLCRRLAISRNRTPIPILDEIIELAKNLGATIRYLPPTFFQRFKETSHQGIAAFFEEKSPLELEDFLTEEILLAPSLLLALDHIEDPRNLGALLRSAWGFGVKGVIIPKDRSALLGPTAMKTSAGGAEHVPLVRVVNLASSLEILKEKGFWTVAAESKASEDLYSFSFPQRTVLILGSEGKGLRRLISEKADYKVSIPLAKGADSLNVATAA